ncbi:zinc finger and SCAN domain-containing protein 5C-like isoform X2 [Gadus macrocephalus]|uniref:zinc finger and SCAN domain-containing protein 5C-like isoform X2 n=1 Tax=Gadus macrocephalus TaxID=80720 RepID=UPI0028CB65E1|nr:zinc finger and SCAN domain-containing protein 5C-like isoform X2 [Gadus macrocephalus]
MLINMSPCGSTLEEQLSSIMDVLGKAAVSEISQLFSEGSTTLHLQISHSMKENEALRTKIKAMRSEIFSLRLQMRSDASRASSHFALARANICKPRPKSLGIVSVEDCDDFGDRSTQHGATSDTLHVDAPGSSHMSSHSEELRILSFHGKGEGPLALDGHDTLFTVSELEALNSLSADHSVAKSLEQLVHREEPTGKRTPDTILIKEEEDIGGGVAAVEDCDDFRDRSTHSSTTLDSLHVEASGSSNMSSQNGELRILSVHGKGEGPLADGHDNPFTVSELEDLSSLSTDHRAAKSREHGKRLVHHEELTGHQGGHKGRPCVLFGKGFPDNTKMTIHMRSTGERPCFMHWCDQCMKRFRTRGHLKIHMRTHSGEKPYGCDQCMKHFRTSGQLRIHMRTHSGEKPYGCDHCMKRFSTSSNRKSHMRTHSGEKR